MPLDALDAALCLLVALVVALAVVVTKEPRR